MLNPMHAKVHSQHDCIAHLRFVQRGFGKLVCSQALLSTSLKLRRFPAIPLLIRFQEIVEVEVSFFSVLEEGIRGVAS